MRFVVVALLLCAACGPPAALDSTGLAIDAAFPLTGAWGCPIGDQSLDLGSDGGFSAGPVSGEYTESAGQLTFSPNLDGFCQLSGGVFTYRLAFSATPPDGVLWLFAPGQVVGLAARP